LELGRIDLATFDNPAGLSQIGSTYFQKTVNSGEPHLCIAGEDGSGPIAGGTLETSNVDLSQEFSDMIVTQRGFQACSRLITVSDTMLEELINLKR
jgi:flagellar hook protein FlgE